MNEKIERLQNQVNFLQQKVIQLEQNQILDLKYARRGTLESPEATKSIQQYNLSSNQEKGLSEANFITLGRIPEQERVQIIQTGFQRQADRKISLKQYYESTQPYSLFQLKGYNIKYETIRRTKIYQKLNQ